MDKLSQKAGGGLNLFGGGEGRSSCESSASMDSLFLAEVARGARYGDKGEVWRLLRTEYLTSKHCQAPSCTHRITSQTTLRVSALVISQCLELAAFIAYIILNEYLPLNLS